MVHGVALQPSDLDGPLIVAVHHACAFAQHVHRAHPRAAQPQNIRVQDGHGRAARIAAGDLLDEAGNIDVRGAGVGARRIEAVEAAVGFHQRLAASQRRMDLGKAVGEFQVVGHRFSATVSAPYMSGRRSRKNCQVLRTSAIMSRSRSAVNTSSRSRDACATIWPRGLQK